MDDCKLVQQVRLEFYGQLELYGLKLGRSEQLRLVKLVTDGLKLVKIKQVYSEIMEQQVQCSFKLKLLELKLEHNVLLILAELS